MLSYHNTTDSTVFLLCHDSKNVIHFVENDPGLFTDTGQPDMEIFEKRDDCLTSMDKKFPGMKDYVAATAESDIPFGIVFSKEPSADLSLAKDFQPVVPSVDILDTKGIQLIDGQFKISEPATYKINIQLEYYQALAKDAEVHFQVAINKQPIDPPLSSTTGSLSETIAADLLDGDVVGLVVKSDASDVIFKSLWSRFQIIKTQDAN